MYLAILSDVCVCAIFHSKSFQYTFQNDLSSSLKIDSSNGKLYNYWYAWIYFVSFIFFHISFQWLAHFTIHPKTYSSMAVLFIYLHSISCNSTVVSYVFVLAYCIVLENWSVHISKQSLRIDHITSDLHKSCTERIEFGNPFWERKIYSLIWCIATCTEMFVTYKM